jgi:S-adenosylmethionine:tRNA ribosyltransferase-isomerase
MFTPFRGQGAELRGAGGRTYYTLIMTIPDIDLSEYLYDLPEERIAQYPVAERDLSKLLVSDGKTIGSDIFRNINKYIPSGSLLVFNNTRVIRARLLFRKDTGALIEVLCLEPLTPADYESSFGSAGPVEWKCLIGNLKKWKSGTISTVISRGGQQFILTASYICEEGDAWRVRFEWDLPDISFAEVIELAGQLPLPPYMSREVEDEDLVRYQTVYSRINGSVAAPTAGLHFTAEMIRGLQKSGIKTSEITLHVGAGTFKPIKTLQILEHEMHCEHFTVSGSVLEQLKNSAGRIVPVGTTSVRTLESLYWLGVKVLRLGVITAQELRLDQWEPYKEESLVTASEAMDALLGYLRVNKMQSLNAATSLIIVPGYMFRMTSAIITNFHQPGSTLLLLVSAWTGKKWKHIYKYALDNSFRFLSYGDSSILLRD